MSITHWWPEHWHRTYLEQDGHVCVAGSGGSGDLQPLLSSLTQHEQPCPEGLKGLWGLRGSMKGCVSDLVSFAGDVLKSGIARVTSTTNSRQQCGTLVSPCSELSQLERLLEMKINGNVAPGLVITVTQKPQASRLWPVWLVALCC